MKKLAKELNMHIIMRMKGEFVHFFGGTGQLAQGHWLSFISPYVSVPFFYSLSESVPLDEVNFYMPEFHINRTFKHYNIDILKSCLSYSDLRFCALVHKHLQL